MRCRWDPPYPNSGRQTSTADSTLRASDAERNDVADKLSRHFADGRLDQTEFKARLDRAMGATTRGDLGGLFDDLPPLADEPPPPRHPHRWRLASFVIIVTLVVVAAGSTVWYMHFPWLLLVLVVLFLWRRSGGHHHTHHGQDTHAEFDR